MNKFVSKLIAVVALVLIVPFAQTNAQSTEISVTCNAQQESAYVGDTVTWESHVSGGEAPYQYSWSASSFGSQNNPISGESETASKTYTAAGSYGARLTVTDAAFTVATNIECAPRLTIIAPLEFASCTPNETASNTGYETTWTVALRGGLAPYGFTLSGTDGLSATASPAKITYTTAGTKTATVSNISSSDGQSVIGSWACTSVTVETAPTTLTASCSANDDKVETDEEVVWSVSVSGGDAPYTFNWTGTNSLSGSATTTEKTYTSEGTKTAQVDVASSDGQSVIDATCTTEVSEESPGSNSGSRSSSRNNNDDDDDTSTTQEENVPLNVVTFNGSQNDGTVLGSATTTASTTESTDTSTSTSDESESERSNQLASAAAFFTSVKFWSSLIAIILAVLAWFIFFKRDKKDETIG